MKDPLPPALPLNTTPWTTSQLHLHEEAARRLENILKQAVRKVSIKPLTEEQLYNFLISKMTSLNLTSVLNWAIVAYGKSAADPHYHFKGGKSHLIKKGNFLMLDIWGKINRPDAPYADITHMYFVGASAPKRFQELWSAVRDARDKALAEITTRATTSGAALHGLASKHLDSCGYSGLFIHGLGHDLGLDHPHGPGINLSPRFNQPLFYGRGYTIEPGIYKSKQFGVRSEMNFFLDHAGRVKVTSALQQELQCIYLK